MPRSALPALLLALHACGGGGEKTPPSAPPAKASASTPRRDPLVGGPYPAILVAQAQFVEGTGADGKPTSVPGPAKLTIVRKTENGWKPVVIEDPDSNVFHKALGWDGGVLTIGGTQALLRTWRFADGAWKAETRWNPKFGGKFDRLRDVELGDVDGDGKDDLVIATHDQGVIAVAHPDDGWRVEEVDRQPDTFVHEIEIGDVDGDGRKEFFATPSKPNKLEEQQSGEVRVYRRTAEGWSRGVVEAPSDTHAKEILTADVDGKGTALYVVWEGALAPGGAVVRPVTIKAYRGQSGAFTSVTVATIPDRLMRALTAGDVKGEGHVDLVGGSLSSGLWLIEQDGQGGWKTSLIDKDSSGFEHPVCVADLDGDGKPELYVVAEDQAELRQYRWNGTTFDRQVIAPLRKGDITWNLTAAKL